MAESTYSHSSAYPVQPLCTPCVRTPPLIPPVCVHTPLAGETPQNKIIEGVLFVLKQHGFDAVVVPVKDPKPADFALGKFSTAYADLSNDNFIAMLSKVCSLDDLRGIANRKSALQNGGLTSWSDFQRAAIIHRKYEIQKGKL